MGTMGSKRHGSLFSGIGGFDLAAEWMGWENVFHCEWNAFGQKVLKHYWPNVISYEDITKTDFTIHRGTIDILTGGFPCQPYSMAGKRLGKEDERHLWPEMLRAIREIQPTWVVGENVFGLVNWSGGLVFHEVQADLEAQGYEVQPYVLPACAVNAPHRRDRIWFVAKNTNENGWRGEQRKEQSSFGQQRNFGSRDNERIRTNDAEVRTTPHPNSNGFNRSDCQHEEQPSEGGEYALCDFEQMGEHNAANSKSESSRGELQQRQRQRQFGGCNSEGNVTNPDGIGLWGQGNGFGESRFFSETNTPNDWQNFPTVSPVCIGDDGLSDRLDSITFPKWRNESIKAGGNAIVPQVAYQIFKALSI